MAKLTSWKANGKNSRIVDEWRRGVSSVGYSYDGQPNVSISFPSNADIYDEGSKERNYNLKLDFEDTEKLLRTVFGDIRNALMSHVFGERKDSRHFEPVLNRLGIYLNTYRIPWKGTSAFDNYLYCRAANTLHAAKQFSYLFKNKELNPDLIEMVTEEEVQAIRS